MRVLPLLPLLFCFSTHAVDTQSSRFFKDSSFCFEPPVVTSPEIKTFLVPKTGMKGCQALISYRVSSKGEGEIQVVVDGADRNPRAFRFKPKTLVDGQALKLSDPNLDHICQDNLMLHVEKRGYDWHLGPAISPSGAVTSGPARAVEMAKAAAFPAEDMKLMLNKKLKPMRTSPVGQEALALQTCWSGLQGMMKAYPLTTVVPSQDSHAIQEKLYPSGTRQPMAPASGM